MKYISTRGQVPPVSFSTAVAEGLAPDGGLYLPETLPDLRLFSKTGSRSVMPNCAKRLWLSLPLISTVPS